MLGDREKAMGVPVGPLCDRSSDSNIPKSQGGFFKFVCKPFFTAVAELLDPKAPFMMQLDENDAQWMRLLPKEEHAGNDVRENGGKS